MLTNAVIRIEQSHRQPARDRERDTAMLGEVSSPLFHVQSVHQSSSRPCHFSDHPAPKGVLIFVFIMYFHSLHKPTSVVQIHTQQHGRVGPVMKMDSVAERNISR